MAPPPCLLCETARTESRELAYVWDSFRAGCVCVWGGRGHLAMQGTGGWSHTYTELSSEQPDWVTGRQLCLGEKGGGGGGGDGGLRRRCSPWEQACQAGKLGFTVVMRWRRKEPSIFPPPTSFSLSSPPPPPYPLP